jgi:hypothetical protein
MQTFPPDENGDVFRRMVENGDQLDKPRDIDFNHIFQKEEEAKSFADAVRRLGYDRSFCRFWKEKNVWDLRIVVFMVPTHADVTRIELQLDAVAHEFLGRADGWGSMAVI